MEDNLRADEQDVVLTEEELAELLVEVPDIVRKILQEERYQATMMTKSEGPRARIVGSD